MSKLSEAFKSVLVIEDEVDLCDIYRDFLADEGLHPDFVTNFSDAVEHLKKNKYDLLIADWLLDGGKRISHLLLNNDYKPYLPQSTLIVTAYYRHQDLEEEIRKNYSLVSKPFDFDDFINNLNVLADKSQFKK
jgi:DNA-binding NtrC family response regulator